MEQKTGIEDQLKKEGYLVTFDLSKDKQDKEPEWIEANGKKIFEVII